MGNHVNTFEAQRIWKELGKEDLPEVELVDEAPEILANRELELLSDLSKKYNRRLISLLYELFYICRKARGSYKEIKEFAIGLVQQTKSNKKNIDIDPDEIDETYIEYAKTYIEQLPIIVPNLEQRVLGLAKSLQDVENNEVEEESSSEQDDEQIDLISRYLGELILVAQYDIKKAHRCVQTSSITQKLRNVRKAVIQKISTSRVDLEKKCQPFFMTQIQKPDEAKFHQMSLEMAKLLLLDTGSVNFGIVEDLKEHFIPEEFKHLDAVDKLKKVLDCIGYDSQLWAIIYDVQPPKSTDSPSNELIRACLGMDPSEPITKRHAQIVLLSALLGHPRQTNTGTCFATCVLIDYFQKNLTSLANDFSDLIRDGGIQRIIFRENRNVPFQTRTCNDSLDTEIKIDSEGHLLKTKIYKQTKEQCQKQVQPRNSTKLHKSPGIIAACQALSVPNFESAVNQAIALIGKRDFLVDELITALAKIVYQQQESRRYTFRSMNKHSLEELKQKAMYAFGAQTNHPLFIAWEQSMSTSVDWLGSQYTFPHWIYESMFDSLKLPSRAKRPSGGCKTHVSKTFRRDASPHDHTDALSIQPFL